MNDEIKKLINDEKIYDFFIQNFSFSNDEFENENELLDFYVTKEIDLSKKLDNILSTILNVTYKKKQLAKYFLNEKLLVSFKKNLDSEIIIQTIKNIYNNFIKKKIINLNFDSIRKEKNIEILSKYYKSEIEKLKSKFLNKLKKKFNIIVFPKFIISKYEKLIQEKYLTLVSSKGFNISKVLFDEFKIKTNILFEQIFIKNEENMFLTKTNKESYKLYLDYVMLCNYSYFQNENILDTFLLYSNYLYHIFNLNELNKNSEFNELFVLNQTIQQLIKENLNITKEEADKKLNLIFTQFDKDINKILSIILCLTLIFNGLIVKKKDSPKIFFTSNIDRIITNAKMKVILLNSLIAFENYVDVEDISNFSQSCVVDSLLPQNDNLTYDIREIYQILKNPKKEKNNINANNNSLLSTFTSDNNIISPEKKSFLTNNMYEIQNIAIQLFENLLIDKKNIFSNFWDNLTKEKKDINIRNIRLESLNPKIHSTHCIIFISGFLSENKDHIKEWDNLTIDLNKSNVCYYYNWPSDNLSTLTGELIVKFIYQFKNKNNISNYKSYEEIPQDIFTTSSKKAKLCGKILALIIASKLFFKYQTISLVGFSLGTHLIKNCIKMLYKINSLIKCDDIIKDVILIAGATSMEGKEKKYEEMFDIIINGKIINCWSNDDKILQGLYNLVMNKNAIGYGGNFNLNLSKFKSLDFSSLNLGHTEYRNNLDLVIQKIKLMS